MADVTPSKTMEDPLCSTLHVKEEIIDDVTTYCGAGNLKITDYFILPESEAGAPSKVQVKNEWLEEAEIGDVTSTDDLHSSNSQLVKEECIEVISTRATGAGTSSFEAITMVCNTGGILCQEVREADNNIADSTMNLLVGNSSTAEENEIAANEDESIHGNRMNSTDDNKHLHDSLYEEEYSVSNKPYACDSCSYRTHRKQTLKLHIMRNHTGERPFSCDLCNYKCCKGSQLKIHQLTHIGKKPYACDLCDYQCTKSAYLKAHKKSHISTETSFLGDTVCNTAGIPCGEVRQAQENNMINSTANDQLFGNPSTAEKTELAGILGESFYEHFTDATDDNKTNLHVSLREEEDECSTSKKHYACDSCSYITNLKQTLKLHVMRNHTGERPFTCDLCDYKCCKGSQLKTHQLAHMGKKPYACDLCDYQCTKSAYLKAHKKTHLSARTSLFDVRVGTTGPILSEEVKGAEDSKMTDSIMNEKLLHNSPVEETEIEGMSGESFQILFPDPTDDSNKTNLHDSCYEEEDKHSPLKKPYACDSCSYRTHRKQTLKLHILRSHTDEKPFNCDLCDYKCCKRSQLKKHELIRHAGKKPYSCDLCDYQCTKSEYLKAHKKTHVRTDLNCHSCDYVCQRVQDLKAHEKKHIGENMFSCNVCEHKCDSAIELETHMAVHPEERPYACDFCDYRAKRFHRLKLHLMRHTGEKPLACDQCDYRGSDPSTFRRHLQSHSGEKPFSCDLCDYRCVRAVRMQTHMRTHTGLKMFSCQDCDYRTSDSSSLRRHMLTHTGDKPFSCDLCDYRCRRACHLKSHMKNHKVS